MVRPQRGRKREGDSSVASKKVWEDKTMAAKEQTSARQSLTEKISTKEKISYGCGDLASNLILVLTSTFVAYFYTDALGLNAAIIGSIMMFSIVALLYEQYPKTMHGASFFQERGEAYGTPRGKLTG